MLATDVPPTGAHFDLLQNTDDLFLSEPTHPHRCPLQFDRKLPYQLDLLQGRVDLADSAPIADYAIVVFG
jgi:hypothetical protein